MFTEREIEEMEPLVGEYGYYGEYVYPEEFTSGSDRYADEQWLPIEDNPDYWVSTHGRVWSSRSQMFIKPKRLDRQGHLGIAMSHGNHASYRYLHRLMAQAFIPNPNRYSIVRHLNDNKDDNTIENLAWGTQKDNHRDCVENGNAYFLTEEDRIKSIEKCSVPVTVTEIRTGIKTDYKSLNDAVRATGVQQANACKVLNGKRRHTGGFIFERMAISDEERN